MKRWHTCQRQYLGSSQGISQPQVGTGGGDTGILARWGEEEVEAGGVDGMVAGVEEDKDVVVEAEEEIKTWKTEWTYRIHSDTTMTMSSRS